jgi:hypothetical protein
MANSQQTAEKLKTGIKIPAEKLTTVQLLSPTIELLIGGPYQGKKEMVTYGHMAVRVSTSKGEKIYDFGRYGDHVGPLGDGILRIWTKFSSYIAGENAYGRSTKGFTYEITEPQAEKVIAHYSAMTKGLPERVAMHPNMKEYKLPDRYHGVTNNCVTMS